MRPIKFRGKRIDNGEWVYGDLVMVCNGETLKRYPCIVISYNHDAFDWHEVHPETVGQFTGLTDKNGREIYEGDVVKIDDNHPMDYAVGSASSDNISHHKIFWDNERAMFWDTRLEDGDSLSGYCDGDISFVDEGKVIGNIHEGGSNEG